MAERGVEGVGEVFTAGIAGSSVDVDMVWKVVRIGYMKGILAQLPTGKT